MAILRTIRALAMAAALSAIATPEVFGQSSAPQSKTVDLTQASLEDLMNIEVTSVSRKSQKWRRRARPSL